MASRDWQMAGFRAKAALARASYRHDVEDGVVYVVDLDDGQGPSVTNDAGGVVEDLVLSGALRAGGRLLYRDSEGRWDEIVVLDGRFAGFRGLGVGDAPDRPAGRPRPHLGTGSDPRFRR